VQGWRRAASRAASFKNRQALVRDLQKAVPAAFFRSIGCVIPPRIRRLHDPKAESRVKFPGGIFAPWVTDLDHALILPLQTFSMDRSNGMDRGCVRAFLVSRHHSQVPAVLSRGGCIMFENQQRDDVEALMKADAEFRRLYQHHQELDSKVHDAEIGVLPIDDMTLSGMKKEKLHAKERLQRMWDNRTHRIN